MNLREDLIKIWKERINQKIDASVILMEEIKKGLSIPIKDLSIHHAEKLSADLICDLASIESSLARQRKDHETSQACIDYVLKNVSHQAILNSFLFQFEMGIRLFVSSKWLDALEYFQRSNGLAADPICKSASLANLAFCYENIGLSTESQIKELKTLVSQFSGTLAAGITAQIDTFEFRSKWRSNVLNEELLQIENTEQINQLTFLKAYWSVASFYTTQNKDSIQIEEFAQRKGTLFNRDFRMRTLTLNPDLRDASEGRVSDFIERLYLWTRIWMNHPESTPTRLLALTMEQFPWHNLKELESINIDDQTMLLVTLRWLAHFDNRLDPAFKKLCSILKFNSSNKYFSDERDFQDSQFTKVLNLESQISFLNNESLIVDLRKFSIIKNNGDRISSPSLAKALSTIKSNTNISIVEFYSAVFDGQVYDSFLNSHQLSSLLYKLNQLIGVNGFIRQRHGRIICDLTNSLETIKIVYPSLQTQHLVQNNHWSKSVEATLNLLSTASTNKKMSPNLSLELVKSKGLSRLRRQDLQEILKLSKTESQRLLEKWIELGKIKRQGFGKATVYQIQNMKRVSA